MMVKTRGPGELERRFEIPKVVRENVENIDWATAANLANEFRIAAKRDSVEIRALEKKIYMHRMVLAHRLEKADEGAVEFDAKFFTRIVRLLEESEKLSRKHRVDLGEFSSFLWVILEKMKKEKLVCFEGAGSKFVGKKKSTSDFWRYAGK